MGSLFRRNKQQDSTPEWMKTTGSFNPAHDPKDAKIQLFVLVAGLVFVGLALLASAGWFSWILPMNIGELCGGSKVEVYRASTPEGFAFDDATWQALPEGGVRVITGGGNNAETCVNSVLADVVISSFYVLNNELFAVGPQSLYRLNEGQWQEIDAPADGLAPITGSMLLDTGIIVTFGQVGQAYDGQEWSEVFTMTNNKP